MASFKKMETGTFLLTRRSEKEHVHRWALMLKTNPGFRNNPETDELGRLCWKIYIGSDVTPRDVMNFLQLDLSEDGGFYAPDKTGFETREGDDWITCFATGPCIPIDTPIIESEFSTVSAGSIVRVTMLGTPVFRPEEEEEVEESEGEDRLEYVYTLECVEGKYYVGRTSNPKFRLEDHFDGGGSAWTRRYQPIKLVDCVEAESRHEENKVTLECMERYGVENVRGGIYSRMVLGADDRASIEKQLRGAQDRCIKCGSDDHFVNDCPGEARSKKVKTSSFCVRCGRTSHAVSACKAKTNVKNETIKGSVCFKCGRSSHDARKCYAKSDIWGNRL
jgi:hypothetical protein